MTLKEDKNMEQNKHPTYTLLEDLIDVVKNRIEDLFRLFSDEKVDLDTLAHQLEERILPIANKKAKEKGITYAGGTLTIRSVTESHFSYEFSLYFQNTQGKWFERSGNSPELSTTHYLTDEAIKELHEKKEIKYELEETSTLPTAEAPQESKNTSAPSPRELPEKSENISAPNT